MISDFHHVPGRLRVRTAVAKGDIAAGSRLRGALYALPGVAEVRASPVTGSITVAYDSARVSLARLLQCLEEGGVKGAAAWAGEPSADASLLARLADLGGRAAVGFAIEQVVQRSALSLLAALF